ERILVHLSGFLRHAESYECPVDMTQDWIATALSLSRAHVALELKRLKSTGKVQERMAHVANARSRRKVYELTPAGQEISRRMREHARARTIELSAPEGRRTVLGAEAIDAMPHGGLLSSFADFLAHQNRRRLKAAITRPAYDPIEVIAVLREDLAGCVLAIDDLHASPAGDALLRAVVEHPADAKILVATRTQPTFF